MRNQTRLLEVSKKKQLNDPKKHTIDQNSKKQKNWQFSST